MVRQHRQEIDMAFQQGQYMNTLMTRVNEVRTTARGRLDQVRARVRGMGIGGGGLFKQTAGIKTYSQGFAGPRILDRFRQTQRRTSAMTGPPRTPPGAPIMSFNQPGAPVKTFAKESLRAIKTF